jgi:CheY-like chemotaxis protein
VLVDDEADVLETVKAVLDDPFEVLAFTEPRRALAVIASMPVDVLCTDYQMPEMDGLELLSQVRKIQPNLGLILMTGRERSYYRTVARIDSGESRDLPLHVLIKPTPPEDLIQAISRAASFSRVRRALDAIGNKGDR